MSYPLDARALSLLFIVVLPALIYAPSPLPALSQELLKPSITVTRSGMEQSSMGL